jgi:phage terminase large subunit-like protein
MDAAQREELIKHLHDVEGINGERGEWVFDARDAQIPPADDEWTIWCFMGARASGKTTALSQAVHLAVRAGVQEMAFISPTAHDCLATNIMGQSGIMHTAGRNPLPRFHRSKRQLEFPSGARVTFYSGEEPDQLRGPECEICFVDELARMPDAAAVFDMANFTLRLGEKPRMCIGTTPRTTPFMKKLVKMPHVRVTSGTTMDNAANLPAAYLKRLKDQYEGTRIGRQEMLGLLILTDPSMQLFKEDWIKQDPVPDDLIEQVSVGVDPSGGGDEIGIVVGALLTDGRLALLADRSLAGSPGQWADEAVRAHDQFDADDIVCEVNFGGAMVVETIHNAAERMYHRGERETPFIRVKEVTASRGKVVRAEPVSLLFEKGKVLHRPGLDKLEAEMLSFSRDWDRDKDGSPNRLDAAVWVLTRLSRIITEIPIA